MNDPDAAAPLLRALARSGPGFALDSIESRRWASATFSGERHVIVVTAEDTAALACWLAGLPSAEWNLPRRLVADLAVAAVERQDGRARITLEALTLDRD